MSLGIQSRTPHLLKMRRYDLQVSQVESLRVEHELFRFIHIETGSYPLLLHFSVLFGIFGII